MAKVNEINYAEADGTLVPYSVRKGMNPGFKNENVVMFYDPNLANRAVQSMGLEHRKDLKSADLYSQGDIGIVSLKGPGAMNAVKVLENLRGMGTQNVLFIGACGGINQTGIWLPDRALMDDGVSVKYSAPGEEFAVANEGLLNKFGECLKEEDVAYSVAPAWSNGAVYMTTAQELNQYSKDGIVLVDSESAALFAAGKKRGLAVASGFVVNNMYSVENEEWQGQALEVVTQGLDKLLSAAISMYK